LTGLNRSYELFNTDGLYADHGPLSNPLSRFTAGPFQAKLRSAYSWDGCRDYSALLTMPTATFLLMIKNRNSNKTISLTTVSRTLLTNEKTLRKTNQPTDKHQLCLPLYSPLVPLSSYCNALQVDHPYSCAQWLIMPPPYQLRPCSIVGSLTVSPRSWNL
jgi:hypothetical protein